MVVFSSTLASTWLFWRAQQNTHTHALLNPFFEFKNKIFVVVVDVVRIEVAAENEIDILYSSYTFHTLSLSGLPLV